MYQGCVCDSVGPEPNPPAYTLSLNPTPKPCAPKVKAAYDNLGMGAWTKINKKIACNREGGEEDVDVGRRGGKGREGWRKLHHIITGSASTTGAPCGDVSRTVSDTFWSLTFK